MAVLHQNMNTIIIIYLNSKPIQKCEYNFLPNKLTKLKEENFLSPKFHHRVPKSVLLSCLTATSLLTSSVREWVKTGKKRKKIICGFL